MSGVDAPAPWRIAFDNARDPYTARNALGAEAIGGGGGGGGGAPADAEYIVAATDATLTNERVLTNTATITWDFTTPGQAKASTAAGGGNVSNSGTPTLGQYAKWVTATTIQGVSATTVLGDIGAQPLDADLTAIAALTGTNTIYYRSAANTWSPVVVSTGLAFSGGNLTCTVSTAGSQPLDATLTALAAYNTNGLLTQTAADTFTGRTLTGPAAGITVSNGNGVAGNPTLALANDLAALEALSGTNTIYYRSGSDAWSAVTIGTGLTFTSGTLAATGGGGGTATLGPPQGRLTLTAATPVMTLTVSSATAMRYTTYVGNKIPIYDGSAMVMTTFTELSIALTDTTKNPAAIGASKVNDWFVWNDSGTIRLSHGPDWTNDTTRSAGTALARVDGIWVNNVAIGSTNGPDVWRGTYVGTTRSNASSTIDWIYGDLNTAGFFGVWNCYNRCDVASITKDTSDSWTCAASTIRQMNGAAYNQVTFVAGLKEDFAEATCSAMTNTWLAGGPHGAAVGYNSTTAISGMVVGMYGPGTALTTATSIQQPFGANVFYALDANGDTSSRLFYGDAGFPTYSQNGLLFTFRM